MKFFIDTANIEQIREARDWGILDGVTTNPTLVSKEDADNMASTNALGFFFSLYV